MMQPAAMFPSDTEVVEDLERIRNADIQSLLKIERELN